MAAQHVATEADLANIPSPVEGEEAITDDTGHLWKYAGGTWADEGPELRAAPAPGTAIVGTTTIDALFTTCFGTRSADCGTPTYRWADAFTIQALFTAGTSPTALNASMITCRFEARPNTPTTITP